MIARLASARTGGLLALAVIIAVLPLILPNKFYYDVAIKADSTPSSASGSIC